MKAFLYTSKQEEIFRTRVTEDYKTSYSDSQRVRVMEISNIEIISPKRKPRFKSDSNEAWQRQWEGQSWGSGPALWKGSLAVSNCVMHSL